MKTDIAIAQANQAAPIETIAAKLGLTAAEIEPDRKIVV